MVEENTYKFIRWYSEEILEEASKKNPDPQKVMDWTQALNSRVSADLSSELK